jgi:hypothetical protein
MIFRSGGVCCCRVTGCFQSNFEWRSWALPIRKRSFGNRPIIEFQFKFPMGTDVAALYRNCRPRRGKPWTCPLAQFSHLYWYCTPVASNPLLHPHARFTLNFLQRTGDDEIQDPTRDKLVPDRPREPDLTGL